MICAVTGGRDHVVTRAEKDAFQDALLSYGVTVVRHGAARGVDTWVAEWVERKEFLRIEAWPAQWKKHGKIAGRIRNRAMLQGPPPVGLLIAFPGGSGTAHCLDVALEMEIPVVWV